MNLHKLNFSKLKQFPNGTHFYQEVNHYCSEMEVTHKYIVIENFTDNEEEFDYDYIECKYLINELNNLQFYLN